MSATDAPENDCHHPADADSDWQLASAVDCAEHQVAQSPALIVGRTVMASAWLVGPVAHTLPLLPDTLSLFHSTPSPLTAGPPPSVSATPLRI